MHQLGHRKIEYRPAISTIPTREFKRDYPSVDGFERIQIVMENAPKIYVLLDTVSTDVFLCTPLCKKMVIFRVLDLL